MTTNLTGLNKRVAKFFQASLLHDLYTEVAVDATQNVIIGTSTFDSIESSACRSGDAKKEASSQLVRKMTLSKNILPTPYEGWYVVRYQDEGGNLMLTCVPLSEESAKKLKKDGRYEEELTLSMVASEIDAMNASRWDIIRGKLSEYIINTLLEGRKVPVMMLDLSTEFFIVPADEEIDDVKKEIISMLSGVVTTVTAKSPSAKVEEKVKVVEDVPSLAEALPEVVEEVPSLAEPVPSLPPEPIHVDKSLREVREELAEHFSSPVVEKVEEPAKTPMKPEHPDLKGHPLYIKDHAVYRWIERVLNDIPGSKKPLNDKARRAYYKTISAKFLTSVRVFGEGIDDERTDYYLDDDNIIYVFATDSNSVLTLYPLNYGFSPEVDRIAFFAQLDVIKKHYDRYHNSQKTVRKGLARAKSEKEVVEDEIALLQAKMDVLVAERDALDASIRNIPNESKVHLQRYAMEFNKVFRKNKAGVHYDR